MSPVYSPQRAQAGTDWQVAKLQERLGDFPADQSAYVMLANVYIQKGRETGDSYYYAVAEEAALRGFELESSNPNSLITLGTLALTGHRFRDALDWAKRSLALEPKASSAYGVLGDAQMELGQYEAAIRSYQTMVNLKPDLSAYARVSHIRELMGDVDGAIEAMQLAVSSGASQTEATAWTRVQLGKLFFNSGRLGMAEEQFQAALGNFDGYYLALVELGKVRAAQGEYGEAIRLYEKAVATVPQPATLAALGDLYAKTSRPDQAQLQYDTVEVIAKLAAFNRQLYNRELVLFYADHNVRIDEALMLARKELEVRQDIYGYDALAWALHKNGRASEASAAIAEAMRLGTQDPNLFYHAAMISRASGDDEQARKLLKGALKINPQFSILYADNARRILSEINANLLSKSDRAGARQ